MMPPNDTGAQTNQMHSPCQNTIFKISWMGTNRSDRNIKKIDIADNFSDTLT